MGNESLNRSIDNALLSQSSENIDNESYDY